MEGQIRVHVAERAAFVWLPQDTGRAGGEVWADQVQGPALVAPHDNYRRDPRLTHQGTGNHRPAAGGENPGRGLADSGLLAFCYRRSTRPH